MSDDRTGGQFSEEPLPPSGGEPLPAPRRYRDEASGPPKKNNSTLIVLLIIGGVFVGGSVCCVPILIGLLVPAVQKVRDSADRVQRLNDLRAVGIAYFKFCEARPQGPAKAEDLTPLLAGTPEAKAKLTDGSIVFIYGVGVRDLAADDPGNTVVAYERDAPAQGGAVLFGDGSVRTVTAAEFPTLRQARPKNKGKAGEQP